MIGRKVVFVGRVQGVGFRWTVQQISSLVGAQGWVRNLTDGSVEAVFVGSEAAASEAIRRIRETRRGNIREVRESTTEVLLAPDGFEIRHG